MNRLIFPVFCIFLFIGCSDQSNPQVNAEQFSDENTKVTQHDGVIEVSPIENKEESFKQVDIHSDKEIINSAGVPVLKTIDSTDSNNKPKKIYKFADFGTQLELSKDEIIIGWIVANDTESAKVKSAESVRIAQRLANSLLGDEAVQLVDKVTAGGDGETVTLKGYRASVSNCIGGMCVLKIDR
ncbi:MULTISPECIES: hypothetical protein [unclassified Acinetobacter]|uniref:hypothetical protein n=1 Tax=unclassified Acinetobacter TaxID=196816 RepID=UPI0022AC0339|nr:MULTISPECIES: hypothetical protein [unclassified Acinetobacter]WAU72970.1 hypothetical protein O1450_12875 [Acinetobacter sp. TR11]WAU76064.1 hypothetical protein O1449_12390 [Acinetobacter sp. TR3]